MSLSCRFLGRSIVLLCALTAACAAQSANQFQYVPPVQGTFGQVAGFVTGIFQNPTGGTDFLYVNAPTGSGSASSVAAGELLIQSGRCCANLTQNRILFTGVSNVTATVGPFAGFGVVGYAFALTPAPGSATTNLCIYAGTGAQPPPFSSGVSYDLGQTTNLNQNHYPPTGGKSGCTTFQTVTTSTPPVFGYITPFQFQTSTAPNLLVEDTVNGIIYVLKNDGNGGTAGAISGVTVATTITLPPADGAGPMYTADLNGDGYTDLVVNNQAQTGLAATVYLGNGDGTFQAPMRVTFGEHIHSLLLQDMDHDLHADMVVEVDNGVIEIHKGNGDGTFQAISSGGTALSPNGFAGNGGHLAAINPNTLDILTTTPIGMSLLRDQGGLNYVLKAIYNIGPGRNAFALGDFLTSGSIELAVDSAEGVAIINGNTDGTFQASNAYTALAPGLSAVVGRFRNFANNPKGIPDVVVGTGAIQGQLLTNDGTGKFTTYPTVVNASPTVAGSVVPADTWSNVLSGDFDGDGNLDVFFSLTGLPQPPPATPFINAEVKFGNGDGTFRPNYIAFDVDTIPPGTEDGYFLEADVGDFDGDAIFDVTYSHAYGDFVELGDHAPNSFSRYTAWNNRSQSFNYVAAGFFKTGRSSQQDLVFQQGSQFLPYVNKQDGTGIHFTAGPALVGPGAPLYPSQALLTDVDGDGNGDLVVMYYDSAFKAAGSGAAGSGSLTIWYGNGDGTFQAPISYQLGRNYYLGAVADMNADGLPDLVLSDGSLVSILYNLGGSGTGKNRTFGNEQHFLAGQGINSISLADVNGDGTPDLIVANGGATISNAVALGGRTAASLALTPNPDVNTGGITVLLNNITTSPVTGTLVATPEPSAVGATFTLTAMFTPSPGVALPTGVVWFSIDGQTVGGLVNLVPGATSSTATYTVPAGNSYTARVHPITAQYFGDTFNSPLVLTGAPATHSIGGGGTTTTTLYLCIGPTSTCPSNGSVVAPPTPPAYPTMLSMYFGQSYNGVLSTTPSDGVALSPTSAINFNDNYNGVTTTLCTLVLGTGGGGTCLPPVGGPGTTPTGINVFTGVYPGDANHTGSSSIPITINVAPDTTTATLTGTPNPSPQGQPVTFTATVTGNAAAPTGPVVFTYGTMVLGSAQLVAGSGFSSTATLTTTVLPQGTDVITATYAATTNFNAASASFTETITQSLAGSFTITVTPSPVSVGVGYSALLMVTVTPRNGFVQGVNLTCANLPGEASCFFDNPAIAVGGGTSNLVLSTSAPHTCGTTTPYFLGSNSGGGGPWPMGLGALAGVAMLFVPGKRRWLRSLIAVAVVAAATQITGCGTCTDLGTRPATYTFHVVGTATGSSTTQAQSVTLTVTI
jgi:hypothetical protein